METNLRELIVSTFEDEGYGEDIDRKYQREIREIEETLLPLNQILLRGDPENNLAIRTVIRSLVRKRESRAFWISFLLLSLLVTVWTTVLSNLKDP